MTPAERDRDTLLIDMARLLARAQGFSSFSPGFRDALDRLTKATEAMAVPSEPPAADLAALIEAGRKAWNKAVLAERLTETTEVIARAVLAAAPRPIPPDATLAELRAKAPTKTRLGRYFGYGTPLDPEFQKQITEWLYALVTWTIGEEPAP